MASSSDLRPAWQVYVYFKVAPENKTAVIEQSMRLQGEFQGLGITQGLMERADDGGFDTEAKTAKHHTLMEVYTPSDCKNGISCAEFTRLLQQKTLGWCSQLAEAPIRITEVFVNTQVA
ncbi:MAG: hypothetical protein QE278_08990 [Limnobacter sp.]|nr:hypothetical protein [Limnobacter sp.]